MARSSTAGRRSPFLPQAVSAFLRRRLVEATGVVIAFTGVGLLTALATHSAQDPSLNRAAGDAIHNVLGWPGAVASDLLLQTTGAFAVLPGIVFTAWGLRIATTCELRAGPLAGRFLALIAAMIGLTMAFASWALPDSWGVDRGIGGALGQLLLNAAGSFAGLFGVSAYIPIRIGAGVLGLGALIVAFGFSVAEWMRGAMMLGRAADHTARVGLEVGRRGAEITGEAVNTLHRRLAESRERAEPRLSPEVALAIDTAEAARSMRPPVPHVDDDDDEEIAAPVPAPVRKMNPELPSNLIEMPKARPQPGKRAKAARQATLDLLPGEGYSLPALDLLAAAPPAKDDPSVAKDALEANARLLMSVLEDFGIKGEILKVRPGPVVTLYELEPAPGIKASRVIGLADDIARSMSSLSARIAVVPGRNVIGIELPNARRETVYLRELLASEEYEQTAAKLNLVLGKDIGGTPVIADLARMPHLLIAGTTGSGKSVGINTMILSLLYRLSPQDCRFIMIDPKMLELSVYDGIPHLLAPVVTEPGKAVVALRWTVKEMENRYRAMSTLGVRNITSYNQRLAEARKKNEKITRTVQTGFEAETGKPIFEEQELDLSPLPYIVVIIDEMADLMLVAGKEIEGAVQRLSQMARAAGIHVIMATQRPSVDVITGTIKSNFPTRISFQVTSKIDSRTILGESGAEQLLGQGDMLYMAGGGRIVRVHGPFVSDSEVESVVNAIRAQGEPEYVDAVTEDETSGGFGLTGGDGDSGDELYDRAVNIVLSERKASTSFIQRHLQIGYNRAARIIERMEAEGVVSPANHVGKREVLPGGGR
ncbi:MAG TPA: DNA translocase FtsK 4TM domain-containing protein [Alphaproteobacteria bacterium]|jgi:S-DNA-T family DNA segregation ATPase FtsK/SpoIIIE|nr:DNA translocase FtsK 4TM domain-containing protein [Alphaproteobacteria bacterium]